jgi:DNA-directed RNA polymerase subunit beta
MELQTKSYARFLQADVALRRRDNIGLQAILREVFPITSYDGSLSLEFVSYELGQPRYNPDECRQLRLTYGAPFKIRLKLMREEPVEEDVYLGEVPLMIGGGEFIINGAERVIVSQLHRSPGVDFSEDIHASEKKLHSCRIIPERGSWIEVNATRKDTLTIRIDQSGKFPASMLLRAISPEFSSDADIIRAFYPTDVVKTKDTQFSRKVKGKHTVVDIIDETTGEILVRAGEVIPDERIKPIKNSKLRRVEIITEVEDPLILNTVAEDATRSYEEALLKIFLRLRPGNPPQIEKAKELFWDKFFNPNKYRLGRVGRFRINRKFSLQIPETEMTLNKEDLLHALRYLIELRDTQSAAEIDDIDHLGNRRIRTIDELAGDEFRKGFLKLKRTVQERMSLMDPESLTPRNIINSKTVSSAIEYFFGRGELSQVVDQTNPLAQLTHERRLSALGPGGLNRKRAGFEVRDVHISHYGRICPIETPEGTNIGLISSLSIYAAIDEYGFLITPYREVKNGKVTGRIRYLRADEEDNRILIPADTLLDEKNFIKERVAMARLNGDFMIVPRNKVEFMDVSPKQLVGVSASLIPFLEHDDANRALMGSNMQRQAVPLLTTEPPIVCTGMEGAVAENSGMVVIAEKSGTIKRATSSEIQVGDLVYPLRKFIGLNERTCLNQRPCVQVGDRVEAGDVIADGAGTLKGELALGHNVLVAFLPYDGYNFEDAILVSEKLVKFDAYTSIHIDEFEIEIRETKLGREEFTRDIPNVSEKALSNLDEDGIVRIGTYVKQGDILVGKVVPKSKSELLPEEKLLYAIFGRAGEDVKNDSLEVPSGVEGIVIEAQKFSRKTHLSDSEKQKQKKDIRDAERSFLKRAQVIMEEFIQRVHDVTGKYVKISWGGKRYSRYDLVALDKIDKIKDILIALKDLKLDPSHTRRVRDSIDKSVEQIELIEAEQVRKVNHIQRGDELPTGVLEMVKVYVATKRTLSVGDKIAGRHGNKGVIAKILPEEDMPFLDDGTPVEILLNPLGVPSRMNVGQILETHLGWAAKTLGFTAVTPVFNGYKEEEIHDLLEEAELPRDGKVTLFDGRTGKPFDQQVTVGFIYMMKLHHLVDDKVHARATGPYSLITQQPLGGKARFGGQRFGEMEVWALEAYGAAHVLQELLTVKSDDVEGRTRIYESMVKGENTLEPGTPVSFDVLMNEIKGLALNIELNKKKV